MTIETTGWTEIKVQTSPKNLTPNNKGFSISSIINSTVIPCYMKDGAIFHFLQNWIKL